MSVRLATLLASLPAACVAPRVARDMLADPIPARAFEVRTEATKVVLREARLRIPRDDLAGTVVELDARAGGTVVLERWVQGEPGGVVVTLGASDLDSSFSVRFRRDSAAGSIEIEREAGAALSEEGARVGIAPRRPLRLLDLLDPAVDLPAAPQRASAATRGPSSG